jgi:predicted ester cyclase
MSQENKALVRRLYYEAINKGDLSVLDEIYDLDAELHIVGVPEDPFGPSPIHQMVTMMREAFPGVTAYVEDMVAEGDRVVVRATFRRHHDGRLLGVSPQARLATWTRIDIYRVFRGRIVEQWSDRDEISLLSQLGVVPPPPPVRRPTATGSEPRP